MRNAYLVYADAITPLGCNREEIFARVSRGISGIRPSGENGFRAAFTREEQETCFEKAFSSTAPAASTMLLHLLKRYAATHFPHVGNPHLGVLLCSTKGDIETLAAGETSPLLATARRVAKTYNRSEEIPVISNACISGLQGLIYAQRLVASGVHDDVLVLAADGVSEFVEQGFQSLQAVSPEPCAPFDAERKGISLGEGAALALVSANPSGEGNLRIVGGAITNDANHITGPSRDGSGLLAAIEQTLSRYDGDIRRNEKFFFSPHGTGTLYNDEMESKAFHAAGIDHWPAVAYKGYFGHTLGASGLMELAVSTEIFRTGIFPSSAGYATNGVTYPLHFRTASAGPAAGQSFRGFLKTGSGFGGCNAAVLLTTLDV